MNRGQAWRNTTGGAAGRQDVACSVFLARHSAWLDDELTPLERAAHERHLEECASCGRYARVLERGTELLRELPPVQPSEDFAARLQHRLFHVDDERLFQGTRRRSRWLATAALLGVVAATPLVFQRVTASRTQAALPASPAPQPVLYRPLADGPLQPGAGFANAASLLPETSAPAFLEQGYTPVVIRPPVYRAATASVTYGE